MSSELSRLDGDPLHQIGLILDQRYRVVDPLGAGPIHQVVSAHDILDNTPVVLKIPKPRFRKNDGFAMRYRRDLLDIMMLSDKNWHTPLALAEHEGVPFQVLPPLEGVPLHEWFEKVQRNEKRLIALLNRALEALARLHKATGRMHGSIKPTNLYVTEDDEPIFTDLAATGRLEDHFSEKARSGEPVYCSPEQLAGVRAGVGSDLYSLGLVIYHALARRHPYFGQTEPNAPEHLLTSLLSQLQSKPTPPSNFAEDVPRWADRFLARCLDPHPSERFAGCQEALNWLKNHTKRSRGGSDKLHTLPPAGRESEMKFLQTRLEQVLGSRQGGSIVRLRGELGGGKTRCVQWLTKKAKERGMKVIVVESIPESGLHLQSVVTALCSHFPELASDAQPVVESLLGIAMDEPLLMVIRDIQQADDTLVEFLREVSSVLGDLPLLLILMDEETVFRSANMRAFIAGLKESIRLEPLDRRAIANLIEEKSWTAPTPSVCAWVHQVSGGNPLHATLLVEYLQAERLVSDALELAWVSSPPNNRPTLDQVVEWKLSGLSDLGKSLLETAAVLGHPFRLSTLNAITYHHEEEVDQALGEGVSKGLIELAAPGGAISYRWKHPKFRAALLDRLHGRRKQRVHRLAAAFYSRGEPEPSKMAYHFLQAGDTPELFYWGSLAIDRAYQQNRRGECNYWMNVLTSRIPEHEWLGPDIQKARQEVSRDQAESLDLILWPRWLRTLSGRPLPESEVGNPFLKAQGALSSNQPWSDWKELTIAILQELDCYSEEVGKKKQAIRLLKQDWQSRCSGRELFPDFGD